MSENTCNGFMWGCVVSALVALQIIVVEEKLFDIIVQLLKHEAVPLRKSL